MCRGREPRHIESHFGDDHAGGGEPDTGDLIQAGHRRAERGYLVLYLCVEFGDVDADLIDAGQHLGQQERVVIAESAGERLFQHRQLGAHASAGELGENLGVALSGDQRGQHVSPGGPEDVAATTESLICASSSSFSTRFFSAVRTATWSDR